jgi:hypothetical protein
MEQGAHAYELAWQYEPASVSQLRAQIGRAIEKPNIQMSYFSVALAFCCGPML